MSLSPSLSLSLARSLSVRDVAIQPIALSAPFIPCGSLVNYRGPIAGAELTMDAWTGGRDGWVDAWIDIDIDIDVDIDADR